MCTKDERNEIVHSLMRRFGITSRYKGYYQTIEAVLIYSKLLKDEKVVLVTKDIYPEIAKIRNESQSSIERNIRTVVEVCWRNNQKELEKTFGFEIPFKPSNGEFLDMLSYYLNKKFW